MMSRLGWDYVERLFFGGHLLTLTGVEGKGKLLAGIAKTTYLVVTSRQLSFILMKVVGRLV